MTDPIWRTNIQKDKLLRWMNYGTRGFIMVIMRGGGIMVQNGAAVPSGSRYRLQQYCRRRAVSVSLPAAAVLSQTCRPHGATCTVFLPAVPLRLWSHVVPSECSWMRTSNWAFLQHDMSFSGDPLPPQYHTISIWEISLSFQNVPFSQLLLQIK